MYKYVLTSVVKISVMFAKYFEYTITLRGGRFFVDTLYIWSRPMSWKLVQSQSPSCDCGHEPHCQHVPSNKIWRPTESTPRCGWWCSRMAGIYNDYSTCEM